MEQELARIEREIDRRIAHNRKRSLMEGDQKAALDAAALLPGDQDEH